MRAIQPENGFYNIIKGSNNKTSPIAMKTMVKNTIFLNVALTPDGGVWWEGKEDMPKSAIDWTGNPWTPKSGTKAAHPNARFITSMESCPNLDPSWDDPKGVEISAILFGGRRSEGLPLVCQSFSWEHGVFVGACTKTEQSFSSEQRKGTVMNDPFAMRPFMGYNLGDYIRHWFEVGKDVRIGQHPPIFRVNWFRRDSNGEFLWPGFGENIRVLDWILKRVEGKVLADVCCVGYIPKKGDLNIDGLSPKPDLDQLMNTPESFWTEEATQLRKYFEQQVGDSLPQEIFKQLWMLEQRVSVLST